MKFNKLKIKFEKSLNKIKDRKLKYTILSDNIKDDLHYEYQEQSNSCFDKYDGYDGYLQKKLLIVQPFMQFKRNNISIQFGKDRYVIDVLKYVQNGNILLKFCRTQVGINFRYFYIDYKNNQLCWISPNKKYLSSCIKLTDIVKIKKANKEMLIDTSFIFNFDNDNNNIINLSLKIEYKNLQNENEYIYITCKNKIERKIWLAGLKYLVNDTHDKYVDVTFDYINDDIYQYKEIHRIFYFDYFLHNKYDITKFVRNQKFKMQKQFNKKNNLLQIDNNLTIEIGNFITPLVNRIYQLTGHIICSFDKYQIPFQKKDDINILLYQIDIINNVIDNNLKALYNKYKKKIKKKEKENENDSFNLFLF